MIKDFIWFMKASKEFTGNNYFSIIFKMDGLKRFKKFREEQEKTHKHSIINPFIEKEE